MSKMDKKMIAIVAGGTGGHIFPAISSFEFLRNKFDICLITDKRGSVFFRTINQNKSDKFNLVILNSKSPFKKGIFQKILFIFNTLSSILRFLIEIKKYKPDLVIGFGGYSTVIPCLILKIFGKKIITHEQNAIMGRANKLLEKFANHSLTSFENTLPQKNLQKRIFCGTPVRKEFYKKNVIKSDLKTIKKKFKILIFGGSLGSDFFSSKLPGLLCKLDKKILHKLELNHQVVCPKIKQVKKKYLKHKVNANVDYFFDDIYNYFKNTDLIICRAGGSTLAEIIVSKTPSIIIPFNDALDNHQVINTRIITENKLGWVLNEKNFDTQKFNKVLINLISNNKIFTSTKNNFNIFNKRISKLTKNKLPNEILEDTVFKTLNFNQFKKKGN